jgi:hypothetical protein
MSSHSCEFPVVIAAVDVDVRDHVAIGEPALSWRAFVLLLVTAVSSYLH